VAAEGSLRPAFYALAPGGWRDWVTLLHPPYTAWHLSYVVIGAALAPELRVSRLLLTLAAFFLAVGLGAHALDELNGRPLGTRVPDRVLALLAAGSIAGAVGIGIYASLAWTAWLAPFVALGGFLVVAYNLELAGGRFHSDLWFAVTWGAFPVLTAYVAVAERIDWAPVLAAVFAGASSLGQRHLSTQVRDVRRRARSVSGTIVRPDGLEEPISATTLIGAEERALRVFTVATVAVALALVMMRVT
jgi:mannose/fructose/N-acetylgalactosamine-specific phosphotransferase system component IIC